MPKYTNMHNIPLPLAVMLAHDEYEHKEDPYTISVTSLLGSVRQLVLGMRFGSEQATVDIASLIPSTRGTALHDALERAWLSPRLPQTLKELGLPQRVIDKIRINPDDEEFRPLDVFLELRKERKVGKWTVTGKFDMSIEGEVTDLKNTSVFKWASDPEDYKLQLSCYKWLNPKLMRKGTGNILFWFNDFNEHYAKKSDYPTFALTEKKFPLYSEAHMEKWIGSKLKQVENHLDTPEPKLPKCTQKELWQDPPKFKYFSSVTAKRATKVFDSQAEASTYMLSKGKGEVREVGGKVKRCTYCPVRLKCSQYKSLAAQGLVE